MNPVAIFQFSPGEGAGYCASFLDRHSIPWTLFRLDAGDPVPNDPTQHSGFVFMGGPMSANDDLPWREPVLDLIRQAVSANRPCLGHCLGGQLMSKALGGNVSVNPVKEIGWNPVFAETNDTAREWLGADLADTHRLTTFQWHGETFSLPPGATRILRGEACDNQAYVVGNSLGMQCHVEMTDTMIKSWCEDWQSENADPSLPSIQTPQAMMEAMAANLLKLNQLADRLYERWMQGLTA
jgi:GMP synthase-like glutamine amidotransferase